MCAQNGITGMKFSLLNFPVLAQLLWLVFPFFSLFPHFGNKEFSCNCVCVPFLNSGFPLWLHFIPGIKLRTDNEPYKVYNPFIPICSLLCVFAIFSTSLVWLKICGFQAEMQRFTAKIVEMMKNEKLYASQGGPIILSQVGLSIWICYLTQYWSFEILVFSRGDWLLAVNYLRSKTSMETLIKHMGLLPKPTLIGQQTWLCLWIPGCPGSCASKQMLLLQW